MSLKSLLLCVSLAAAAVVSLPVSPPAPDWFAPLVSSDSAAIRFSSRPRSQVLRTEFLRMIVTTFTVGFVCAPSYYEISHQPVLVYYDENDRKQRTTDEEIKCVFHSFKLSPHSTTLNCSGEDQITLQSGYVNPATNQSFVTFETCVDNATDFMILARSRLHRLSSRGEQLPLATSSLSVHQSDDIGHQNLDELPAELSLDLLGLDIPSDKIGADEMPSSSWQTVGPSTVRSYDTWERYRWNAHRLGLGYLVGAAPRISAKLVPVVESIRAKASDPNAELYTGYLGVEKFLGDETGAKPIEVPKYVWFLVTTAANKAVVYVVPNSGHSVDAELGVNRCSASVYCTEIGDLSKKLDYVADTFTAAYSLL